MNATKPNSSRADLIVIHTLAQLLERLERSAVPVGPEQYRSIVLHLVEQFDDIQPDDQLRAVLDTHPAAAELYENLNYRHAGLCRSPLDAALGAEIRAREAIARAMRRPAQKENDEPA
ncbi:MAG TPA: hypothetical protein VKI18_07820 [Albitalea sp.]|nr:hypothetical protein [Albitalea sp.]